MTEYDFYIQNKPSVKHVFISIDAFSVDIPECPPTDVTSSFTTGIGSDIPYHTPDSVSAWFSSSLQCLYLASNHIGTVKPTVSSISSLSNIPTHPRLCKKVNTQSDSATTTVLREGIPCPVSTALDDLELLQPLN